MVDGPGAGLPDLCRRELGVGRRVVVVPPRGPGPGVLDSAGRDPGRAHRFDLVVANPPWAAREARPSPIAARAIARTGDGATLPGFVRAARAALGAAGRACFVYPAADLPELLAHLRKSGLEPKRLRMIHPLPGAPARAALVEAKPARPGGLRVEAPFVAMNQPGVWTAEAARILEGNLRAARGAS